MKIFDWIPEKWRPNRKVAAGIGTAAILVLASEYLGLSAGDILNFGGNGMALNFVLAYGVSYMVPEA